MMDLSLSGIYLAPPWGGAAGGPFLNAVVTGGTTLSLPELVVACRRLEETASSPELKHGSARNLDVDILFLDPRGEGSPGIILPHPRMHVRRFVLVPLLALRPGATVPGIGRTCEELLAECPDPSHITLLEEAPTRGKLWSDAG